ncbi:unnamed protein product [Clavelina lepadiformis]|uniref:J domain-containing protein n=1 Tax=Clavelina lepadiformis TaxID=159417 RepID=A0ABP0GXJ4_CLALP
MHPALYPESDSSCTYSSSFSFLKCLCLRRCYFTYSKKWLTLCSTLYQTDYYKTLDVSRNATAQEIKRAYLKKCKDYHPDKHQGDKGMHEKFVAINEAYSVLSNTTERRNFDYQSTYHQPRQTSGYQSQSQYGWKSNVRSDPEDVFRRYNEKYDEKLRYRQWHYEKQKTEQQHERRDPYHAYWEHVYKGQHNFHNRYQWHNSRQRHTSSDTSTQDKITKQEKHFAMLFFGALVFIIYFRIYTAMKYSRQNLRPNDNFNGPNGGGIPSVKDSRGLEIKTEEA